MTFKNLIIKEDFLFLEFSKKQIFLYICNTEFKKSNYEKRDRILVHRDPRNRKNSS